MYYQVHDSNTPRRSNADDRRRSGEQHRASAPTGPHDAVDARGVEGHDMNVPRISVAEDRRRSGEQHRASAPTGPHDAVDARGVEGHDMNVPRISVAEDRRRSGEQHRASAAQQIGLYDAVDARGVEGHDMNVPRISVADDRRRSGEQHRASTAQQIGLYDAVDARGVEGRDMNVPRISVAEDRRRSGEQHRASAAQQIGLYDAVDARGVEGHDMNAPRISVAEDRRRSGEQHRASTAKRTSLLGAVDERDVEVAPAKEVVHVHSVDSLPNVIDSQRGMFLKVPGMFRVPSRRISGSGYQKLRDDDDLLIPVERLSRRPSVLLPTLVDKERLFFDVVTSGDVEAARQFLRDNGIFNLNSTNFQGNTALHVAVKSCNEPMVRLLLQQPGLEPGDCALHAIRLNQPQLVVLILDHLAAKSPALEFAGSFQSTDFPDYITPLILAAQCGFYEIIATLLSRGHNIERPHPPTCRCKEVCVRNALEEDGLTVSRYRLNVFHALVNPAYICHTCADPILGSFELCKELQTWALAEREFRTPYKELAYKARLFAVELIGLCRSSQEVELVLKQRGGCNFPGQFTFPRLMLALDYYQKEFVAHPNTQTVLESAWLGNWWQWRMRPEWLKLLSVFPRMLMLPVIAAMCIVLPHNAHVTRWRLPCNKMLSSVASYLIFLALVFLESNQDKTEHKRGPPGTGLEALLVIYVIAYLWSLLRFCMIQGPGRFFHVLYNVYDLITQLLFVFTFVFWIVAWRDLRLHDQHDLERKYWNEYDPSLVSEGLFTVATIMAFGRLLLLCELNYHLGPLQVSLGKMTRDIAKYVVIFTIIIFAFAAGLSRFYQYYQGMVQTDLATNIKTQQVSSFVSFGSTLKTLFWGIFCMSPLESADVVIENLPGSDGVNSVINHHRFTEAVGYISFALFSVLSVIMILNMLIATMSNTFQKVTDNVDAEWAFGRTEASEEKEDTTQAFTILMVQLAQRYFNAQQEK